MGAPHDLDRKHAMSVPSGKIEIYSGQTSYATVNINSQICTSHMRIPVRVYTYPGCFSQFFLSLFTATCMNLCLSHFV